MRQALRPDASRRHGLALPLMFYLWPVVLVSVSGPSMADSVLRAAIRLVDRHTWVLSEGADPEIVFLTEAFDISLRDGRIYSGVAPGASVIAAPVYYAARPLFERFDEGVVASRRLTSYYLANAAALQRTVSGWRDVYLLQILLVLLVIAPLYAVFLTRLERKLRLEGADAFQGGVVVLAMGLGTMALFYGSMYSRQSLAYLLAWNAVLLLWRVDDPGKARCALAGLLLGTSVSVDYTASILVGLFALVTLPRLSWRSALMLSMPLAGVLALVALYHHAIFGSWLATPYHFRYWHTPEVLVERGIDLTQFQSGDTLGANAPRVSVMLRLMFGPFKGLFVHSPILLLGLLGLVAGLRRGSHARGESLFALVVFATYLTANSTLGTHVSEYGRYFWGGLSVLWGPRYLFATLPFLAFGLARLDETNRVLRWIAVALLSCSILFNVLATTFSHILMSTFAFSPKLDFPVRYVLELFVERGPREPILDSYGTPPFLQAIVLIALAGVSVLLWRRHFRSAASA